MAEDDVADDLVAAFFQGRGRHALKAVEDMQTVHAPAEFATFIRLLEQSDHPSRQDVLKVWAVEDLQQQSRAQQFRRTPICDGATLYSDQTAAATKALLLCFAGLGGRLGIPTPVFLQRIDARRFDVVILADRRRSRFRHGAGDFATDFVSLIGAIQATFAPQNYARVISFGNSMGANAAAHYAALAGAERAIAIGARRSSDPVKLVQRFSVPSAFEPLCDCLKHRPINGLWLYSGLVGEDVEGAERLFHLIGGQRMVVPDSDIHNVLIHFWRRGQLGRAIDILLDSNAPRPRDSKKKPRKLRDPLALRIKQAAARLWGSRTGPPDATDAGKPESV